MTKQGVESREVLVRPVIMIDVNLIDNADYNPQEQDKVVFNRMVKSIKENGFAGTIQVAPHLSERIYAAMGCGETDSFGFCVGKPKDEVQVTR